MATLNLEDYPLKGEPEDRDEELRSFDYDDVEYQMACEDALLGGVSDDEYFAELKRIEWNQ